MLPQNKDSASFANVQPTNGITSLHPLSKNGLIENRTQRFVILQLFGTSRISGSVLIIFESRSTTIQNRNTISVTNAVRLKRLTSLASRSAFLYILSDRR